jgi:hypothetical protein
MPILDAFALDTDPNGTVLLRSVLDTGRCAGRLELGGLTGGGKRMSEDPAYRLTAEMDADVGAVPIHALVAAAAL